MQIYQIVPDSSDKVYPRSIHKQKSERPTSRRGNTIVAIPRHWLNLLQKDHDYTLKKKNTVIYSTPNCKNHSSPFWPHHLFSLSSCSSIMRQFVDRLVPCLPTPASFLCLFDESFIPSSRFRALTLGRSWGYLVFVFCDLGMFFVWSWADLWMILG